MSDRQKVQQGFSAIEALIAVVVVVFVAVIGYFVFNTLQKSEQSAAEKSSVSSVEGKDLKEYKNADYAFSLKYPATWRVAEKLEDSGRGMPEGLITFTSPAGTVINISANLGGKGGDCIDDKANYQRTARTCMTLDTLKVEKFDSGRKGVSLYLMQDKLTPSTLEGGAPQYRVSLADDQNGVPAVGSGLTDVGVYVINTGSGDIIVNVTAIADDTNLSASYFETAAVKEALPVLKSLRLTSN